MSSKAILATLAAVAVAAMVTFLVVGDPDPPLTLSRAQLELRDGILFPHSDPSTPFTGTLTETYTGGAPKVAIDIAGGRPHGLTRGWFDNGQLELEEHFTAGTSHGQRTRWHDNGNLHSIATVVDGTLQGRFQQWHPNGQLAATMQLVDGNPHGECRAFHPDGTPKSTVVMENGQPVSQHFLTAK